MQWCCGDLRQKVVDISAPQRKCGGCSVNGLLHLLCGHKFQTNLHYYNGVLFYVDPKQQMRIQGWVSKRSSGFEENKSCISLFKLSLLSTLSPRYLADLTFSKVPFMDDVRGRDKFLFVGDTNTVTRQRKELHQPSLFPFLKGIDGVLKLVSLADAICLLSI